MKRFFPVLLRPLPTMANDVNMVTPVVAQIVAARLPEGFVPVFETATARTHLLEAIPNDETPAAWSQRLTLTGTPGPGRWPRGDR